ncbi:NAD(P)H-binding protein [Mucilaginibacter sp. Bleaf8]|uniref:NAD(P)H-binding protein n=1 Tax=Mucilaginibacter sp. Bleaf8 TaxID=2834430 RepID=UPI001BCF9D17|nr:NAD(P)H-binding protein [Mucilaginibacter sp. Bleaf8]MBS7565797.1 NAD(P)H-binding protein [Mucilaginibacter sp. Bleaf8]
MANKAVIAGASGLIGSELLQLLLHENFYDEVLVLVRKELPVQHKKLVQLVIDFDQLQNHAHAINGHAVFCCLGSTRAKTPDIKQYYKIDHDYPVQLAQIALQNNVPQYHLISAIGANPKSGNFYTRLKGETGADVAKVGIKSVHIYQPSLLTGNRKEHRLGERIATVLMKGLNPLLLGGLKKYRSIPAATVARAMYKQSLNTDEGLFIHPSDHIKQLA